MRFGDCAFAAFGTAWLVSPPLSTSRSCRRTTMRWSFSCSCSHSYSLCTFGTVGADAEATLPAAKLTSSAISATTALRLLTLPRTREDAQLTWRFCAICCHQTNSVCRAAGFAILPPSGTNAVLRWLRCVCILSGWTCYALCGALCFCMDDGITPSVASSGALAVYYRRWTFDVYQ